MLELLRVRKLEANQPAVGAARFSRRKDRLGSLKPVQERQQAKQVMEQFRFKRAASCDLALDSDCVYEGRREIFLKRSLSAPNRHTIKSQFFHAPQGLQSSSIVMTAAVIHTKSGLRHQQSSSHLSEDWFKLQDTSQLVQEIPRSKSLDTIASVKCANSCQMSQEVTVQRPKTAP